MSDGTVTPGNTDDAYEQGVIVGYDEAFTDVARWLEAEHPELIDELSTHLPEYIDSDTPMALEHEVPC